MKSRLLTTIAIVLLTTGICRADVVLPDVIADAMVLQRERPVPIWGKAEPSEAISVSFAGQTKKTAADKDGKWRVTLDPLRANATPAVLTIAGKNKIELKDILVGEVWLVAGQSNMQLILSQTANGEAASAAANHTLLRLFNVSRQVAFKHKTGPLADVYGRKITKSGPLFRQSEIAGAKIVLTFDEAGAGLRIRDGDKLNEFAIAGADHKWHWAEAKITGKNRVEVWSADVPQPQAVRYAFNNNPRQPNLTNETGLPAAPFRTDNWLGPTDGKR